MRRLALPYAVLGALLALVGAVGAITLRIIDPVPQVPTAFGFSDGALVGFEVLGLTFVTVGGLLVVRVSANAVGWVMVLIGDGYALAGLSAAVTFSAVADGPAGAETARLAGWFTVLGTTVGGLVFFLGFIFPTGRGQTPTWDRLLRLVALGSPPVVAVLFLIRPGPLHVFPTIDNPFGVGPDLRPVLGPDVSSTIAGSASLFVPILAWSIVSRYRRADSVGRQQLKWFIVAILVTLGGVGLAAVTPLSGRTAPEVGLVVFGFAGSLIPVAIGIAILRYRLYDIDRIVSRSLSYAVITSVLAGVFAMSAVGLSAVLGNLAQGESLSVASATLLVLALFGPLRRRAQAAIDRRFDRARYDASVTVQAMSARLRDDVDLERVEADVLGVVDRTVQPTLAGVWLRGAPR